MELFLKIFLLLSILTHAINSQVILSNNGDRLDLYEGVQYQLINKKSGNQLLQAKQVDGQQNECIKPSYGGSKQYLIFWSASKTEKTNDNNNTYYELIFMSGIQQNNRLRVTIEKSPLVDYYRFVEYKSDSNSSLCTLTQTNGSCGTFQCYESSDEDTQLWKPVINSNRYQFAAQFNDFELIGDVEQEVENKRSKVTIVDGEIINNPRKQPIDHFVSNYYWIENNREKISVDFDPEYAHTLLLSLSDKKFRINLKIPVTHANSISKKLQNKSFNFEKSYSGSSNSDSRRYTGLTLDRITVEPFECIEYYAYADLIDSAVLPFRAKATLSVIGNYGPFDIRSHTNFPVQFTHSLLKSKGVKQPDSVESTDNGIIFTVKGKLSTTLVLGLSNSVKTVTGEPICDQI